jgi:hypothetical protein
MLFHLVNQGTCCTLKIFFKFGLEVKHFLMVVHASELDCLLLAVMGTALAHALILTLI